MRSERDAWREQGRFGEGKFGGVEQVVIKTKDGDGRALSSVLQNVFDGAGAVKRRLQMKESREMVLERLNGFTFSQSLSSQPLQ
jgi:hypothetical protein